MTGDHAYRLLLQKTLLQPGRNLAGVMVGEVLHILRSPQGDMLSAAAGKGADTGRVAFVLRCAGGRRNVTMFIVIVMRAGRGAMSSLL